MKTFLLTACTGAALALSACREPAPSSPPSPAQAALAPIAAAPAALAGFDGGSAALPVDPLAIEHSHRTDVDHLARAKVLKATGDFEGALTEARKALHHDPAEIEALNLVIRVSELTGPSQVLADALGRAAQLAPADPEPLIRQARVLVGMKRTRQALEAAQAALMRDGEQAEAFHVMGRAYLTRGELARAIELFRKATELDPEHGYALNNLGFAYLRANQNEEAVEVLTRAADLLPMVAYVQNNLGVALERVGRVEEAKLAFSTATSLSPKYVKAQVNSRRVARVASSSPGEALEAPEADLLPEP